MRICPTCKRSEIATKFYKGKQSYCKECNHQNTLARQRKFKEKCIRYKGGSCRKCGYDKCIAALEFHHRNPNEKEFHLSKFRHTSWEKNKEVVQAELDKCDLLCANCHRETHYRIGVGGLEPPTSR